MPPMIPSGHSLLVEPETGKLRENGRLAHSRLRSATVQTHNAEQTELTTFGSAALIDKSDAEKRCFVVLA